MNTPACRVARLTPPAPGAIAILHLVGDVDAVLASLGLRPPPVGAMRLVDFAGIDHGLIVRLRDDLVHLMPHGGPRVVQRLHEALIRAGAAPDLEPDPMDLHPEATDRFEALALEAITRAASPLAIDLLLAQPARWRRRRTPTAAERAVSRRLNRLLVPPIVVLAGPPNVGKSTLSNALLGRALSIAADEPGTTRDYTAGLLDLGGLVVRWHDTPGVRATTDAIEARAIDLASRLIAEADLVIAMTDAAHEWPALPRRPDLRIGSKADLGGRPDADGSISARSGEGLSALVTTIRDALVPPGDLAHPGLWVFDDRLDGC